MSTVPFIPDNAPFSPEQRTWLNGFFAGMFSRAGSPNSELRSPNSASAVALQPLTILFGSQTGTAEGLAKRVAKEAGKRHFAATILDMAQSDLAKLAGEKNLLVLTSTYGDGEPPDNAKTLHATLATKAQCHLLNDTSGTRPTPVLASLRYSVCALGDKNYAQFCKAGADFDHYLEKLGATRVAPRADCDLDYEEKFTAWLHTALAALAAPEVGARLRAIPPASEIASKLAPTSDESESGYSKKNPFPALLLTSRNLSAPASAKQINHIEFDLTGSGLAYEAGDALGVVPHNCPALVADVLAALGCDGEEAVPAPDGNSVPLRRALTELYDLGKPSPDLVSLVGACLQAIPAGSAIASKLAPTSSQPSLHHVIDVLLSRPPDPKPQTPDPISFVRTLRKLQPRLYSISSSPRAHANQVHLTIGAVRYRAAGRDRKGVCSTFLADRVVPGETRAGVFVHSNKAFRPPPNGDTPMIMVGPGTGIAPFRAFLEERRATGARGKNWLFFGHQRAATDFIYRDDLLAFKADATLTRLDLAWSRDQPEKIYVQNRMAEHAAELFAWLEAGAHFYVCGDASRMAKDVDAALHAAIERAGGKSPAEAAAYVQSLKAAKRYARDVY